MEIVGFLVDAASAAMLLFGLLTWLRDRRRLYAPVQLVLTTSEDQLVLPYKILRKDLSRQEVAGVIGFYSAGRRYHLPALAQVFSDGQYRKVLLGKSSTLFIPAGAGEFELFKEAIKGS